MPTMGELSAPDSDPKFCAEPKAATVPLASASQYPVPLLTGAMSTVLDADWTAAATWPQVVVMSLGGAARAHQDGGDGAVGVPRRRERRAHGEDRRAGRAIGELVQDDVAVTPAPRQVREAAGRVGRRRATPTVVVHPVVVGLEDRRQTAGPDGAPERDGGATGHRRGERRVCRRVCPALGVGVELVRSCSRSAADPGRCARRSRP